MKYIEYRGGVTIKVIQGNSKSDPLETCESNYDEKRIQNNLKICELNKQFLFCITGI